MPSRRMWLKHFGNKYARRHLKFAYYPSCIFLLFACEGWEGSRNVPKHRSVTDWRTSSLKAWVINILGSCHSVQCRLNFAIHKDVSLNKFILKCIGVSPFSTAYFFPSRFPHFATFEVLRAYSHQYSSPRTPEAQLRASTTKWTNGLVNAFAVRKQTGKSGSQFSSCSFEKPNVYWLLLKARDIQYVIYGGKAWASPVRTKTNTFPPA